MTTHFFIDETKAKGYVVVAVACPASALGSARKTVDSLVLPGQRSIHMKNESARRRALIVSAVSGLTEVGVSAVVLDAGRGPEPEIARRERALRAIVALAVAAPSPANLTLDLDQTLRHGTHASWPRPFASDVPPGSPTSTRRCRPNHCWLFPTSSLGAGLAAATGGGGCNP